MGTDLLSADGFHLSQKPEQNVLSPRQSIQQAWNIHTSFYWKKWILIRLKKNIGFPVTQPTLFLENRPLFFQFKIDLRIEHIHGVKFTKIRPPGTFCLIILQTESVSKICMTHSWPNSQRWKKCVNICKVLFGGRVEIEKVKIGHFASFSISARPQRALIKC